MRPVKQRISIANLSPHSRLILELDSEVAPLTRKFIGRMDSVRAILAGGQIGLGQAHVLLLRAIRLTREECLKAREAIHEAG